MILLRQVGEHILSRYAIAGAVWSSGCGLVVCVAEHPCIARACMSLSFCTFAWSPSLGTGCPLFDRGRWVSLMSMLGRPRSCTLACSVWSTIGTACGRTFSQVLPLDLLGSETRTTTSESGLGYARPGICTEPGLTCSRLSQRVPSSVTPMAWFLYTGGRLEAFVDVGTGLCFLFVVVPLSPCSCMLESARDRTPDEVLELEHTLSSRCICPCCP